MGENPCAPTTFTAPDPLRAFDSRVDLRRAMSGVGARPRSPRGSERADPDAPGSAGTRVGPVPSAGKRERKRPYGSRHSALPPFSTCAQGILAWTGGRSDLLPSLNDQFDKGMKPILERNSKNNEGAPGNYRSYGFDLGALVEAATVIEMNK